MPNPPISFRPNDNDLRIMSDVRAMDDALTPTDILRRGLRLLERDEWRRRAHLDAIRLKDEDLSNEPPDWSYAPDGSIVSHIGGIK